MDTALHRLPIKRGDIRRTALIQHIQEHPSPICVLSSPALYGKTMVALDYYQKWGHRRCWFNASHVQPRQVSDSKIVGIALEWFEQWSFEDQPDTTFERLGEAECKELSDERVRHAINRLEKPTLFVIDDVPPYLAEEILHLLQLIADVDSNYLQVVVTSRVPVETLLPEQNQLTQWCLITSNQLRVPVHSVHQLLETADFKQTYDDHANKLVNLSECEGVVGYIDQTLQLYHRGESFESFERLRSVFIRHAALGSLSDNALQLAICLLDVKEFDQSLYEFLAPKFQKELPTLVEKGVFIEQATLGIKAHYYWHPLLKKAVQTKAPGSLESSDERGRLLVWADQTRRYSDALALAMKLDSPDALSRRLVETGRWVQEQGSASILRQALEMVEGKTQLEPERWLQLRFVDLAAYSMQPGVVLKAKIAQAYRETEQLSASEQAEYKTWVQCIEAQCAMGEFRLSDAERLAVPIARNLNRLPSYYRVQALSVLGEISLLNGHLEQALSYYRQGERDSEKQNLPSSLLWHWHQQAQVQTMLGQTSVAEHLRFMAIQKSKEMQATHLFPYQCLLRAHCEQLLGEMRVFEAESYLLALEETLKKDDADAITVHLLSLEFHRLKCLLDPYYRVDIGNKVLAVEAAALATHHPHVAARADRSLLNYWRQTEQIHRLTQWYERQPNWHALPVGPDQLLMLRNSIYAYLVLATYDVPCQPNWPEIEESQLTAFETQWPKIGPMVSMLYVLSKFEPYEETQTARMQRAMSAFSQTNFLAELLSYMPQWLEPFFQGRIQLHRYQLTFLSRVNALWGGKNVRTGVAANDRQNNQGASFGMSAREWQLLGLISRGLTNERIAEQLNLSIGTVKNQLTRVYRKLGVTGREPACSLFKSMADAS